MTTRGATRLAITLGMLAAALGAAPAAQAYTCGAQGDDFPNPSGQPTTNIGSQWIERNVDWFLTGGGRANHQGGDTVGLATFIPAASGNASICADVSRGTSGGSTATTAAGVVTAYGGLRNSNLIEFVNSSGSPSFNRLSFRGEGGNAEGAFIALDTPFQDARIHVVQNGPVATVEIDLNFDFIADETHTFDFAAESIAATGTGAGIATYSSGEVDNFRWEPFPPPAQPGPGPGPGPGAGAGAGAGSGSPGAPPNIFSAPDRTKPALGSFGFSASAFRAARSGASISAKKKAPTGTKVSFTVSEPGAVRFTVQRKASGRKVGGRCKAASSSNRRKPKCTLWKNVAGSFSVNAKAGANTFTFRGRIGGKALAPGSYRLNGTATDAARNASLPRQKAFTIVR